MLSELGVCRPSRAARRGRSEMTPRPLLAKAACMSLGDSKGGWVQFFPAGDIKARDGRAWRMPDPDGFIARTKQRAGSTPLVIDYEHQTQNAAQNGRPAPAAGWITDLEHR